MAPQGTEVGRTSNGDIDGECRRCKDFNAGECDGRRDKCLEFNPVDVEPFGEGSPPEQTSQKTGAFPPGASGIKTGRDNGVVPPRGVVPAGILNRHAGDTVIEAQAALQQASSFFKRLGHGGAIIRSP